MEKEFCALALAQIIFETSDIKISFDKEGRSWWFDINASKFTSEEAIDKLHILDSFNIKTGVESNFNCNFY